MLAALVAGVVWWITDEAGTERDRWGNSRTVLVTVRTLAAGDHLAGAVEPRRLPLAAIPDEAVDALPTGARVRHPLAAGSVVTARAFAAGVASPAAAALPGGWRGLAVARTEVALPVVVGDAVDVVAIGAVDGDVARPVSGVVVAADDHAVTVAVPADAVPLLATAVQDRRVLLTLRAP